MKKIIESFAPMLESPQSLRGKEGRTREKYFKPNILSDLGKKSQTFF